MGDCKHPKVEFKALPPTDPMPGCFVCLDCGARFAKNPNDMNGVRYLGEPAPNAKDYKGPDTPESKMND